MCTPSAGAWGNRPATSTPSVTATTKVSGEQDIEVTPGPTDAVSALAFSPTADVLAVASWDGYVRIYRIDKTNAQPVQPWQQYQHEGPVLDVTFSGDGSKVISGGADKMARCFDLNTNQSQQVAQHDDTVRCVKWIQAFGGALVTGSWDKKIKLWKIEPQPTLITTIDAPERVYAMDVIGPVIIAATAERKIVAYQVNEAMGNAQQVVDQMSPLKYQSRSLAALPDGDGFALGGTEGRVAVHYFHDPPDPKDGKVKKFAFRCHRRANADHPDVPRNETYLYPVNAIVFNNQGTFATGGGDGSISFWCKESRTRLKTFETKGTMVAPKELFKTNPNRLPVTAIAFNRDASVFAYALGYDWHKGYTQATNEAHVFIHPVNPEDIKKRPPKA
ncbi:RNA export factor gle2 [Malassezia cuniculi]|uniref:RNA export factor gle2 n=1 Tax=Malassezia cuniculi TaxID=948313 RepID=A0AAF0J5I6_9BASI|nr:RNA export factor gle2 [Malassezia cuniculi]